MLYIFNKYYSLPLASALRLLPEDFQNKVKELMQSNNIVETNQFLDAADDTYKIYVEKVLFPGRFGVSYCL